MAINEELVISIKFKATKAKKELDGLTDSVGKLDKKMKASAKEMKWYETQVAKVGASFTALNQTLALTAKVAQITGAVFGATLGKYSDFEKGLLGVAKTTGQTRQEAEQLASEMQALSVKIPVGTNELLGLAEAAGQLGVKGNENLSNFAETMAKLGRSSDLGGEEASRNLAKLLNVTGENIDQIDELASVIVRLGNNFAATESEILKVSSEIGRSTVGMGLSSDQVVALATSMKAMGGQAQLSGSAVGRTFREIKDAVDLGGAGLQTLIELTGKSGAELKKQFGQDSLSVFKLFLKGVNGMQKEGLSLTSTFESLNLAGDEIAKSLPPLASSYNELEKALKMANEEKKNATALDEEALAAFNSLNADTALFKNSMINLGVAIGNIFMPVARELLQSLTDLGIYLSRLTKQLSTTEWKDLAESIVNVAIALGTIKLIAFIPTIVAATTAVGGLTAAFNLLWKKMLQGALVGVKVAAPFIALAAAAALVDILIRNMTRLGDVAEMVADGLELLVLNFNTMVNGFIVNIKKLVSSTLELLNSFEVGGIKLVDDDTLESSHKSLSGIYDRMLKDNKKILDLQKKISKSADGIDFGLAGKALKIFRALTSEAKDAEKAVGSGDSGGGAKDRPIPTGASDAIKLSVDQIKILNKLMLESAELQSDINAFGKEGHELLKIQLDLEQKKIAAKEKELKLEGNLVPEIQKQIDMQKELLKIRGELRGFEIAEKDLTKTFGESFAKGAVSAAKAFNANISGIGEQLNQGIDEAGSFIAKHLGGVGVYISEQFEKAGSMIGSNLDKAATSLSKSLGIDLSSGVEKLKGAFSALEIPSLEIEAETLSRLSKNAETFGNMFTSFGGLINGSAQILEGAMNKGAETVDKVFGTSSSKMVAKISKGIKSAAEIAGTVLNHAFTQTMKLFDPSFITSVADTITNMITNLPAMLQEAFNSLSSAITGMLEALPQLVDQLFDIVLSALQTIIQKLPEIIDGLASAFINFLERLPEITGMLFDALPGIIDKLLEKLPDIITQLFEAIPQIITQIISAIPDILVSIMDRLPMILERLIEGLIGSMGQIVASFIDFLIGGGLEKIIKAFIKMIPRLAVAFVKGVVKGLQKAISAIFSGVKIPALEGIKDLPKKIEQSANNLGKNIAKEASNIFKVADLNEAGKGLGGGADPAKAIEDGLIKGGRFIEGLWLKMMKGFRKTWKWIEGLWKKLMRGLSAVWEGLMSTLTAIFDGVISGLKAVWDGAAQAVRGFLALFESLFTDFIGLLTRAWQGVYNFFQNLGTYINRAFRAVLDLFKNLFTTVKDAFDPILEFYSNLGTTVLEAFQPVLDVFDNLGATVMTAFQGVFDVLGNLGTTVMNAFQSVIDLFSNLGSTVTGAFQTVLDTIGNLGTNVTDGFKKGLSSVGNMFTGFGTAIWNGLKSGLSTVGTFLKNIFDKLNPSNLFDKIFKVDYKGTDLVENTLGIDVPFLKFNQGGMVPGKPVAEGDNPLNDRILALLSPGEAVVPRTVMNDPVLGNVVRQAMEGILPVPKFFGGFKAPKVFGGTTEKLLSGDAKGVIDDVKNVSIDQGKKELGNIASVVTDMLAPFWESAKKRVLNDMILRMMEQNKFHKGGPVGFFKGGEVPATLQTGEFVMNKSASSGLGLSALSQMNQTGKMPGGNSTYNFDVKVSVDASSQSLDESYVRNRLIPSMKEELKRSSLRGEFLMSEKGLRA